MLISKFFINSRNPVFGPLLAHFSNFRGRKNFYEKFDSFTHKFIWYFRAMPNLEKNNNTIPRKHPEIRTEGRMEGRIAGRTERRTDRIS